MAQWQDSGLTQKQFCEDKNLAFATFRLWRQRLAKLSDSNISDPPPAQQVEAGFVGVEITDRGHHREEGAEAIEILLPSGVRLQVPAQCSGQSLAEVLWALQATNPC